MPRVKLTVLESKCRCGYHKKDDAYIVEDLCPPICHELWQNIYPSVYVLLNNGDLDYGGGRDKRFEAGCPDHARVIIRGEAVED